MEMDLLVLFFLFAVTSDSLYCQFLMFIKCGMLQLFGGDLKEIIVGGRYVEVEERKFMTLKRWNKERSLL